MDGRRRPGRLGDVWFANLCTVRSQRLTHLVVAGVEGPVTVLIMPEESIRRSVAVEDGFRRGRTVPYRTGALAAVSERPEPFEPVEERFRSMLQWVAPGVHKPNGSA